MCIEYSWGRFRPRAGAASPGYLEHANVWQSNSPYLEHFDTDLVAMIVNSARNTTFPELLQRVEVISNASRLKQEVLH